MQLDIRRFSTVAEYITEAKREIDEAAGRTRAKYITTVQGQAETYQMKAADAEAYKAAGYPADTTNHPWVAAEAAAQGKTPQQATDFLLATRAQWVQLGTEIERVRLQGKIAVAAATTIHGVLAAKRAAIAALEAM